MKYHQGKVIHSP